MTSNEYSLYFIFLLFISDKEPCNVDMQNTCHNNNNNNINKVYPSVFKGPI